MAPPAAAPATEAATAAPLLLAKCSTTFGICNLIWDQDGELAYGKALSAEQKQFMGNIADTVNSFAT